MQAVYYLQPHTCPTSRESAIKEKREREERKLAELQEKRVEAWIEKAAVTVFQFPQL
jgi:hypothetical protein